MIRSLTAAIVMAVFAHGALAQGQYVAAAVASLSRDGHFNPAFQTRVMSTATPFTLSEGQQLALDLQLMD